MFFSGVDTVDYNLYPSTEYQKHWLRTYLSHYYNKEADKIGNDELDKWIKLANKFALASHMSWGIWALLQEHWSSIDFDFLQ